MKLWYDLEANFKRPNQTNERRGKEKQLSERFEKLTGIK